MILVILPLGKEARQIRDWVLRVIMYTAASTVGAALLALGMIYGAARGLPAVIGGISMLRDTYPLPVSNWLIAHLGWWHALNAIALLVAGSFLVGSFVL